MGAESSAICSGLIAGRPSVLVAGGVGFFGFGLVWWWCVWGRPAVPVQRLSCKLTVAARLASCQGWPGAFLVQTSLPVLLCSPSTNTLQRRLNYEPLPASKKEKERERKKPDDIYRNCPTIHRTELRHDSRTVFVLSLCCMAAALFYYACLFTSISTRFPAQRFYYISVQHL